MKRHVDQNKESCQKIDILGQVLMAELVKLRQQQQTTKSYLQTMERRLKKTETRQQLMMNFLARAIQNPDFIQQLIHQKDKHKELEEAINRKRRRHIDQGQQPPCADFEEEQEEEEEAPFVNDIHMDVDLLAVEMNENDHYVPKEEMAEKGDEMEESLERSDHLDEGFWENLLNEANEDGDELVDRFGFLNSNDLK